jgi:ubiquitin
LKKKKKNIENREKTEKEKLVYLKLGRKEKYF